MEEDRAGTRERRCLKLNKTGLYPEEVTVTKDRDKDWAVPCVHMITCVCVCVCLCFCHSTQTPYFSMQPWLIFTSYASLSHCIVPSA